MILTGDCLAILATIPEASIQTCITSPPYWSLRDYGVDGQLGLEPTPEAYVEKMVQVFRAVRRVLKDDGTLWLNLGDSYNGGGTHHGSNNVGISHSAKRQQGEWTTNVPGLKPKDLVGIPWRVAFALQADGWYLRSDIIWAKPNPMPESVMDRPTKAHEYIFLLSKRERYYYDAEAIAERSVDPESLNGRKKRNLNGHGLHDPDGFGRTHAGFSKMPEGKLYEKRNARSVWNIPTYCYRDAHFATFPPKLIEPCVLAGSRPGDTVLDPFAGSGTTLEVAKNLNRQFVGIELNPAYIALIEQRLAQEVLPL